MGCWWVALVTCPGMLALAVMSSSAFRSRYGDSLELVVASGVVLALGLSVMIGRRASPGLRVVWFAVAFVVSAVVGVSVFFAGCLMSFHIR